MEINIKNDKDGHIAGVTSEHQLRVQAEVHELQHHVSRYTGMSYQARGETGLLTAGTIPVLHLINNDPDRRIVVSFIRTGLVGSDATMPGTGDYFSIGFNTAVTGGTDITPVNMNATSGADALVTVTAGSPTSTGTMLEFDRWYPQSDGDKEKYDKKGSMIIGFNDTLQIAHTTTATTGIAWARVSFMMMALDTA